MPEVSSTLTINIDANNIFLQKNQNGYIMEITELVLSDEQAASLALVVNSDTINIILTGTE